jgi:hypothetical protein
MMRLLFLDIDGVLNAHEPLDPEVMCGTFHPDKIMLLNQVLRQTDAKIVLSSAWRYLVHRGEMNLDGLEWLLRSHGVLAGRLHGITRKDSERKTMSWDGTYASWVHGNERGKQIAEYLGNDRSIPYAVVDDLDLGISDCGHPFVQTDGAVGLRIEEAQQLVKLLTERPT